MGGKLKGLDFDKLFPGRFIKAGDFNGREWTGTIKSIRLEELPKETGGTQVRGIIAFEEWNKEWVLNRTNGECLKAMFGRDTGEWIGKHVTLHPITWQGEELATRVLGSPDLKAPVEFELKLPRKKAQVKKLLVTGKGKASAPPGPGNGAGTAPAGGGGPPAASTPPDDGPLADAGDGEPEDIPGYPAPKS